MLYFVSAELSLCYLLFAFLSSVGVLQWVAARYRLDGLAFLDYAERPWRGYALAGLLVLVGALTYFGSQWAMIFTPGPAGAELTLLFGIAALCALLFTLILASLLQPRWGRKAHWEPSSLGEWVVGGAASQKVTVGPATGHLYIPPNPTLPMPAVCLLPGWEPSPLGELRAVRPRLTGVHGLPPTVNRQPATQPRADYPSLMTLAGHLVEQRLVVLLIEMDAESYTYPEILAILPAAVLLLSKLPEVDPQRIGVLGHDLGADLAIRSASVDRQIKAVVALAPVLIKVPISLDLLHELPYLQALHWARDRQRASLRTELTALEYGGKITPRPLLLIYGVEDRLVAKAPGKDVPIEHWGAQQAIIQGAAHLNLVDHPTTLQTVGQWFKEHL